MNMPKYNYRGYFLTSYLVDKIVENSNVEIPDDWNKTENYHITTSILKKENKPKEGPDYEDIGKQASIKIKGYAFDKDVGLALIVESIGVNSEKLNEEIAANQKEKELHITIAMAPGHKPKEAADICANPENVVLFDEPVELSASYGGFTNEKTVDIFSPEEKEFMELAKSIIGSSNSPYKDAILRANAKDPGDNTVYLKSIIDQRTEGKFNMGSSFKEGLGYKEILSMFVSNDFVETTEKEMARGAIRPGTRSVELNIPGNQGVISAKDLPEDAVVWAVDGHGVGSIEFGAANISKIPVNTTTLIIAADRNTNDFAFLLTALPGDVRSPSSLEEVGVKEGTKFTKKEVIELAGPDAVIKFISNEKVKEFEDKNYEEDLVSAIMNEDKEKINKLCDTKEENKNNITEVKTTTEER